MIVTNPQLRTKEELELLPNEVLTSPLPELRPVSGFELPLPVTGPNLKKTVLIKDAVNTYKESPIQEKLHNLQRELQTAQLSLKSPYRNTSIQSIEETIRRITERDIPEAQRELAKLTFPVIADVNIDHDGRININGTPQEGRHVIVAYDPEKKQTYARYLPGRPVSTAVTGSMGENIQIPIQEDDGKMRMLLPIAYLESTETAPKSGIWNLQISQTAFNNKEPFPIDVETIDQSPQKVVTSSDQESLMAQFKDTPYKKKEKPKKGWSTS
ncbi:hypothetical protein A2X44_04330 [candidate division CPR3 bacterium GWF2_35_18]|uniref:Uncharacterized protein n=1 Tax=candidate division CPR3 bacterium GW2011_GWF2_35_18 TaxID=1618350 RepID=A0A0G0BZQ9_UNCC3|nr:MAG: hypothetical protein UR67_C0007G0056 [candidate division CPR3 bacterium GW2011_GWF2_35_18]KKP86944.1 MAG: hypothetical protein UR87_C0007G0006 [candidate division CPR3 bacterium GW2011_GWE2_35_7]OGB62581.1 MAG: hypothetical protein A2X44_04330 [candidate division CPR3 bacterium GWF2_35_18]OGB65832.1 MAG: hypothetical protein A2250_01580 [candidate division CPR3 bacterium RIFOXYA2_FULL_35_13]OGB77241.1 MAG: hypothetical protein A2476_01620 [candidate division CPR3 bacterium RIFOXYC2_FULL